MYKYYAPRKWRKIMDDAELRVSKAIRDDVPDDVPEDAPLDSLDDNSGAWVACVLFLLFVIIASIEKI